MRTNFLPRSYYRGAAEQASSAAADVPAATPESCSSHVLHQAPRTDAVNNTSRSPRAMLASARKSLASLRKRLPMMCLGSPTTEATQTPGKASTPHASVQSPPRPQMAQAGLDAPAPDAMGEPFYLNPLRPPPRHQAPVAPARTREPVQVRPSRNEERWQQQQSPHRRNATTQAPRQMEPTRAAGRVPVREYEQNGSSHWRQQAPDRIVTDRVRQPRLPESPPLPASLSVSPTSSSPTQGKRQTLLGRLNAQLVPYNQRKYQIDTREDPTPTEEERELLRTRQVLIDQRNEIRDIQLDSMLTGLAPMENIHPPKTTTSRVSVVQHKVIETNRRAFLAVEGKELDMGLIGRDYARAQRRIEPLEASGADYRKIKRLKRMMEGYQNWLALRQMIDDINDQLALLGAPQLSDSDPSTPREREDAAQEQLDRHGDSMENGYR
ncbi:type III secretion system effector protein XopR [Xanthomonas oryzae pv. oryzae]|uniref:type III secretion system effector protein XopR n=1 Tax=Xanthomonas oryzae TaxID=347 RepID=UPI0003FBD0F9|nr:type III secretion system effector protein XopR [Xanthomonas oryzae]AOS04226.1 type III effector protein XopR [Xanthomonas oryzae pv. oryzae]AOS20852.1 type III effector protein XopR [Xanthomonas oryzae pv. oryzae]AOS25016.1 type III effector protein XopR [Xanthomonas oryzae pv. oryzae]AOS33326.1 type III effector protein XopR [Xanthomonas oryzae pv. oryzae]QBA09765.1 type III effector protein XopR [Xanthomonas oryzae pv. oryzae]